MIKKIPLFVILFTFFGQLVTFAQVTSSTTKYTVKGEVIDSTTNETVPFCTVSVINPKMPMVYLKRVAADVDGKFKLEIDKKDSIQIKFESVGMETTYKTIVISDKTTDLGKVLMISSGKSLAEVTVTAAKPLVQVDLDKISYDFQSDPDAQSSNVLTMLQKVPMLSVDADDNIQLKGKSNFKILMNGKETNMMTNNPSQVLKSIPANTIKKVEVITDPGPKYEADGITGIINIVTESALKGYMATVNAGIDSKGALEGGIYFTTKIGKIGVTTYLNSSQFKNPVGYNTSTRLNKTDQNYLSQESTYNNNGLFNNGSLSVSYEVDSLDLITLRGSGWGGNNTSIGTTDSKYTNINDSLLQAYFQNRNSKNSWGGYEVGLDYQRSFKKPEKLLTFSYQLSYSPYGNASTNWLDSTKSVHYFTPKQSIKSNSLSNEHTFQVDYTEPFNKKHVIGFGAKYIIRNNNSTNTYQSYNETTNSWENMSGYTNDEFNYRQDILGTYASYTFKLNKFSARAGARYEYTKSSVSYKVQTNRNFDPAPFSNLIPSLSLSYKLDEKSNIKLSYTQSLSRPSIWYLNPFVDNTNTYYISKGNPNLQTEIGNSFNFNYSYFNPKVNFNGSLYYSFTNNAIEEISTLHSDTVIQTYQNIGINRNLGLSTYFRWQITPELSWRINANAGYVYLADGNGNSNEGINYGGNSGGDYNLPKDWSLSFYTGLHRQGISLQGAGGTFFYYGLSVKKSFFDKKLNLSLRPRMFLQKYMTFSGYTETATYRSDWSYRRFAPNIEFNVSFRFGQMKEQIKTTKKTIENNDLKSGGSGSSGGEGGM